MYISPRGVEEKLLLAIRKEKYRFLRHKKNEFNISF